MQPTRKECAETAEPKKKEEQNRYEPTFRLAARREAYTILAIWQAHHGHFAFVWTMSQAMVCSMFFRWSLALLTLWGMYERLTRDDGGRVKLWSSVPKFVQFVPAVGGRGARGQGRRDHCLQTRSL